MKYKPRTDINHKAGELWKDGGDWFLATKDERFDPRYYALLEDTKQANAYLYKEYVDKVYCFGSRKPLQKQIDKVLKDYVMSKEVK